MLPKFFAEFEDLQNDEVDRLLDLCEHDDEEVSIHTSPWSGSAGGARAQASCDEAKEGKEADWQIRILGIGGLGTVAKKDIRWVKGNVNVLLQLLESREYKFAALLIQKG